MGWAKTNSPEQSRQKTVLRTFYGHFTYNVRMGYDRYELRCTDNERTRWEESARKSGRSLAAWLRWLANTASQSPIVEQVSTVSGVEPNSLAVPKALAGVRTASEMSERPMVVVRFARPATWKLVVDGEVEWESVQRPGDPRAKAAARSDLERYCTTKDIGGFRRAWDDLESEMSDGEWAG